MRRSLKQILFPSTMCAVCVPPGTRLLLQDISEALRRRYQVGPVETVTFVQQSTEAFRYRDAVGFSNGRQVLLQRLEPGQRVRVLSMNSAEGENEYGGAVASAELRHVGVER